MDAVLEQPTTEVKKPTKEEQQALIGARFPEAAGWKCIHLFGVCWRVNQYVKDGWVSKMVNSHFVTVGESLLVQ